MSGRVWLDGAMLAVSLFNAMLVLWLGSTVLLNANRRHWGVWLMGGGLFIGAGFFISHSVIVGQALGMNLAVLNTWWRSGWIVMTLSPFTWYIAVLWYGGFWSELGNSLARRHLGWLWLTGLGLLGLLGWMLGANPIPTYEQLTPFHSRETFSVPALSRLVVFFPVWMVSCVLLSIDALLRPAPASDRTTARARQHARPWLLTVAGAFLVVGVVVTYVVGSVILASASDTSTTLRVGTVAAYDLSLLLLITAAALALGQAIVSYEIFTGRVLPRHSLLRHWRNAIFLAGGYAAIASWSIAAHLRPIDSLLLAMVPIALFYALYSWRSLREQEQFVARLRPFLHGMGSPSNPPSGASASAKDLLVALCRHVLDSREAQLIPLGSMAPLMGQTLVYPPASAVPPVRPPAQLEQGITPLDPQHHAPYSWAVPVRSERGLIGVLLLGEKLEGGLYSQEEMEIAQATAERILHLLAGEQMVRHLMALQRRRTAEQRVMDLRTRRALHDEILPALHLAILDLNDTDRGQMAVQRALDTLVDAHRQIATLLTDAQPAPARGPDPCELVGSLQTLLGGEFAHQFEDIRWHGDAIEASGDGAVYVDAITGEVVLGAAREVIRNAALHGRGDRPDRPLCLDIDLCVQETELILSICDNGVGMNATPAATQVGSGSGLALHSTLLAMVGGYLTVEPSGTSGTQVRIVVARQGQGNSDPLIAALQGQGAEGKT